MSGLQLTMRDPLPIDCDTAAFWPRAAGMSPDQALRQPLAPTASRHLIRWGDCFTAASRDDGRVVVEGDLRCLHGVGSGWSHGELIVEGDVGDRFASEMSGGCVHLRGNCSRAAAEQMSGGSLRIEGDCGDDLGGPKPGRRSGMSGGKAVVAGDVRGHAGYRMRRGTIIIRGSCGPGLACDMVAGTMVVLGSVGRQVGAGMKRGTLIIADAELPPYRFSAPRPVRLSFASLLAAELAVDAPEAADQLLRSATVLRAVGDLSAGGMGEIWLYHQ